MAVRLSELGAIGVLNLTPLPGSQSRTDRIAAVGKESFVPLMQELYSEPVQETLIHQRIREIKDNGGIAAVSGTPVAALWYRSVIADAGADLFFAQATVVSTDHIGPAGRESRSRGSLP